MSMCQKWYRETQEAGDESLSAHGFRDAQSSFWKLRMPQIPVPRLFVVKKWLPFFLHNKCLTRAGGRQMPICFNRNLKAFSVLN